MSGFRSWFAAIVVVAVTIGLGYIALRPQQAESEQCFACRREVHGHSRTVAMVNGRSQVFCCPACALSERDQEGKPIAIVELTDFLTAARLTPNQAFMVKGSDVNMCAQTHGLIDADKREAQLQYDRCAPSLLAFATREDATQFARRHGGEVSPWSAVSAVTRSSSSVLPGLSEPDHGPRK